MIARQREREIARQREKEFDRQREKKIARQREKEIARKRGKKEIEKSCKYILLALVCVLFVWCGGGYKANGNLSRYNQSSPS